MINIGILGLGTVGQGIVEILEEREKEIEKLLKMKIKIKKIMVKNLNLDRGLKLAEGILTDRIEDIVEDDEISIVIEVTSSLDEGYQYIKLALENGKHVVTANKAILSKYFEELSNLAYENKLALLYEASVAGGIPVLKALKENLVLNEFNQLQGILNGTCNYILTRMVEEGLDYGEVLRQAQDLGYAEADPAADVEGHDTLRKLRILATLGLQGQVLEEDIVLEGIQNISKSDIQQIKKMGRTVKLIGEASKNHDGFQALVMPSLVSRDDYFAGVNGVFNSVALKASNVGDLRFYGPGAGKLPTANAILSDVLDIALDNYRKDLALGQRKLQNLNSLLRGSFYLRISKSNKAMRDGLDKIKEAVLADDTYIAIVTKDMEIKEIYQVLKALEIEKDQYFIGKIL